MADVVTRASGANPIKNGGYVVCACPANPLYGTSTSNVDGNLQTETLREYHNPPVSGVNGVVTDGPLDIRFDDYKYYTT